MPFDLKFCRRIPSLFNLETPEQFWSVCMPKKAIVGIVVAIAVSIFGVSQAD
jgi:hypothetical protein